MIPLSISISISIFLKDFLSISISISIFSELPYRYRFRYRYFPELPYRYRYRYRYFQKWPYRYRYRYRYFSKVSIYRQSIFDIDISNRANFSCLAGSAFCFVLGFKGEVGLFISYTDSQNFPSKTPTRGVEWKKKNVISSLIKHLLGFPHTSTIPNPSILVVLVWPMPRFLTERLEISICLV